MAAAASGVVGPPVWADPIGSLESPASKPPPEAHRPSQNPVLGGVSRPLSTPQPVQQHARPKAIEFCAGSAGLTRALASIGFEAVGVDWVRNRHRAKAPVIKVDLSTAEGQATAFEMMRDERVRFVHFGPPCGTFTRARDKRVPRRLVAAGAPDPPQLRSERYPLGLPGLCGVSRLKVESANAIAQFVAAACTELHSRGVLFTVENPRGSYLWLTPWFVQLFGLPGMRKSVYQACMHGAMRDKWQALGTNVPERHTSRLELSCDGSHAHLPWGASQIRGEWHFATAEECAYPPSLCAVIAACIRQAVQEEGVQLYPPRRNEPAKHDPSRSMRAKVTAIAGRQPRGVSLQQLVPEFRERVYIRIKSPSDVAAAMRLPPVLKEPFVLPDTVVPAGSKLLRRGTPEELGSCGESRGIPPILELEFGVHRTPVEFIECAKLLQHPFDAADLVSDASFRAIFATLTKGAEVTRAARRAVLKKWRRWAVELQPKEDELHARLPESVASVYRGKRLLLLQRILDSLKFGYPDVVRDVIHGCRITGDMGLSGIFPPKRTEAAMTVEELWELAPRFRRSLAESMRPSGDVEVDRELYEQTKAEVEQGLAAGPFTEKELCERLGPRWFAARRFGVKQGPKTRCVDDFSEYMVNMTVVTQEKAAAGGVDAILALARSWLAGGPALKNTLAFRLSDGKELSGEVHQEFRGGRSLQGKCVDLASAYKQLAVSPADAAVSVISVWNPHRNSSEYYEAWAMPFGATAAVTRFNRCSAAIEFILAEGLQVVSSSYFDDFSVLTPAVLAESTESVVREFFELIGWPTKASKDRPFEDRFKALGVIFDFAEADATGEIRCGNTPERIEELRAVLDQILRDDALSAPLAGHLAGRLVFARSQTFGRCGGVAASRIYRRAREHGASRLDESLRWALHWWRRFFVAATPRIVKLGPPVPPVLLWTDGAHEETSDSPTTCGALLIDQISGAVKCFGFVVPEGVRKAWQECHALPGSGSGLGGFLSGGPLVSFPPRARGGLFPGGDFRGGIPPHGAGSKATPSIPPRLGTCRLV